MKTIWKWQLERTDQQTIRMPQGAAILSASKQNGSLTIWAEVETDSPTEDRTVFIVGTGNPKPTTGRFIASVFDGPFVWHVFESRQ